MKIIKCDRCGGEVEKGWFMNLSASFVRKFESGEFQDINPVEMDLCESCHDEVLEFIEKEPQNPQEGESPR